MDDRSIVDSGGFEWDVHETMVGAGATREGGHLPRTAPWITFRRKEDGQEFGGPSGRSLGEMSDEELLGRLANLRSEADA